MPDERAGLLPLTPPLFVALFAICYLGWGLPAGWCLLVHRGLPMGRDGVEIEKELCFDGGGHNRRENTRKDGRLTEPQITVFRHVTTISRPKAIFYYRTSRD